MSEILSCWDCGTTNDSHIKTYFLRGRDVNLCSSCAEQEFKACEVEAKKLLMKKEEDDD